MRKLIASFFIVLFLAAGVNIRLVFASITPNDPYYDRQWYLMKIRADSAWDKVSSSPDTIIAVIDSGVQIDHPDLKDNIWENKGEIPNNGKDDDRNGFIDDVNGWDFVENIPDPRPKFSNGWTEAGVTHGTMVAGIIAARGNNNEGIAGLTWQAKIMPLKVLNDRGEGKIGDVVRAIDYATNNGADIINLSFVSFVYSEALEEAIARAHRAGVIVVAAAGNEQAVGEGYDIDEMPVYPVCYDGSFGENMVIGVAATDALDQKAAFSSYGARCVDISAPGISFFSAVTAGSDPRNPGKIYDGYWSGTSMAAPLVSGALALIRAANPELSRREVVSILFASTDNISRLNPDYPGLLGNGRLNVDRAVEMAKEILYQKIGRLVLAPVSGDKEIKLTAANGDFIDSLNIGDGKNYELSAYDFDDDGEEELVLAAKAGNEPRVKILSQDGKILKEFLVFDKWFRGGIEVAVADLDDDGSSEIIAVQASKGNGQVRIFDSEGKLLRQFYAVNSRWRGGLSVAAGNLDAKGEKEIIIGFGAGAEPQVRIFSPKGNLIGVFLAYEKSFRGGVKVVSANLDGRDSRGQDEIIVAPGPGREPLVKVFDNRAALKKQFLVYNRNWQNGFDLTAGDLNNDGSAEIIVGARPGAAPHVRVFSGSGLLKESFYTWEEGFKGGVNVAIIRMNN